LYDGQGLHVLVFAFLIILHLALVDLLTVDISLCEHLRGSLLRVKVSKFNDLLPFGSWAVNLNITEHNRMILSTFYVRNLEEMAFFQNFWRHTSKLRKTLKAKRVLQELAPDVRSQSIERVLGSK
jgi:hypothetical protein